MQTRDLNYNVPGAGTSARKLLDQWPDVTKKNVPVDFVAVGHCLQRFNDIIRYSRRTKHPTVTPNAIITHNNNIDTGGDDGSKRQEYRGFGHPNRSWINASLDDKRHPSVWRCDVGLSRCWEPERTEENTNEPRTTIMRRMQALVMYPAAARHPREKREPHATTATLFLRTARSNRKRKDRG